MAPSGRKSTQETGSSRSDATVILFPAARRRPLTKRPEACPDPVGRLCRINSEWLDNRIAADGSLRAVKGAAPGSPARCRAQERLARRRGRELALLIEALRLPLEDDGAIEELRRLADGIEASRSWFRDRDLELIEARLAHPRRKPLAAAQIERRLLLGEG